MDLLENFAMLSTNVVYKDELYNILNSDIDLIINCYKNRIHSSHSKMSNSIKYSIKLLFQDNQSDFYKYIISYVKDNMFDTTIDYYDMIPLIDDYIEYVFYK